MIQAVFILADVGFISLAYWLTNNPESDIFLFYCLPIFATVEYLGWKGTTAVCCGVGVAMLSVVFSMHPLQPWTHAGLVWRLLLPRGFFLLVLVLSSAFVFKGLSRRQTELRLLLNSLHSSSAAIPDVQALDDALESILSEITEKLNFESATISLVDEYRDCIETVRGRNISPGQIMRAKHALSARDIQTYIVATGLTKVIVGWDDTLDREIYDRFEHWRLARVWTPIVSADSNVVGTIEAACNKERKDEVFTESAIHRVQQLGREKGDAIARNRPHVLLKDIAKNAIQLIGADSATLHVYRRNANDSLVSEGSKWGELILAAGAGKATTEFVRFDQPSERGMERQAVESGRPIWVDDPLQFESGYPELYGMGVRALAVIPLQLGPDTYGILGVHLWQSGKRFTSRELDLAEMFAREMEGVIHNYLLLRRATESGSRAWALSGLQSLMQSLTSPFHLPDVLQKIAKNALLTLDADNVTVYQYRAEDNTVAVPPVMDGPFLDSDSMKGEIAADSMLFRFINVGASQFIVHVHNHHILGALGDERKSSFVDREMVESCAVLVLRSSEVGEIVGLLFVNFRRVHNFSSEEKRAMYALATSAALAIKTARLHKADVAKQLGAMHAIDEVIIEKGPDLEQALERLLQETLALTGATYGACMRYDSHTEALQSIARWPRDQYVTQRIGEGIVGLAAKSRRSILVEDVQDESRSMFVETVGQILPSQIYKKVHSDTRCSLAVPLLDDGRLLGVLNIEHVQPGGLTEDHKALLETLAVPAIIAFHTVDLYKMLERRIRHLSSLNLIAARVQDGSYGLETILRLFLAGITAAEGLGFSRAMLLLTDPEDGTLRGQSAVGAYSRSEAQSVWSALRELNMHTTDRLDSVLQQAARFSEEIREGRVADGALSQVVRKVSINIAGDSGAVARCLATGACVTVSYSCPDPFREMIRDIGESNDLPHAFACMPLLGKQERNIGVLVVDNKFLPKEREIDDETIAGLEAYAGLLSLTIENALLKEQQIESWKELTGGIAHSVGTRIAAIAGKVTRLREAAHIGGTTTEVAHLLNGLTDGISKAQEVLLGFRTFATPQQLKMEHFDLRDLVSDVVRDCQAIYKVDMTLPVCSLPVVADPLQLTNALMEIIKNSHEACIGIARREVIILAASVEQQDGALRGYARLDIRDNGPGIREDVRTLIFRPFVSTKNGSGLGLAIAKSVVDRHGGQIELGDNDRSGAWFVVRIPMHKAQSDPSSGEANG